MCNRLEWLKIGMEMQGTVLSPFLFIIYGADFKYIKETRLLQKFSDDTAITGSEEMW